MQAVSGQVVSLNALPGVGVLFAEWPAWNSQHDACEFLQHVLNVFESPVAQHTWIAKYQDDQLRTVGHDSGSVVGSFTLGFLPVQKEPLDLSQLIWQWHAQWAVHALETVAPVVCLQLGRFIKESPDQVQKVHTAVHVHSKFSLPVFADTTLKIEWHTYHLISVVIHLGEYGAGHYVTTHHTPTKVLLHDDDRRPQELITGEVIQNGCYLLWAVHDSILLRRPNL